MKPWTLPVAAFVGALISAAVVIGVMAWEPWESDSGTPIAERIAGCDGAYTLGNYLHGRCVAEARSSEETWECYVQHPDSFAARTACRDSVAAQPRPEPESTPPDGNPSLGDEEVLYAFLVVAASAITGAVAIGGTYLGHRLTRRSAIEAEERGFHRERRRARVQPVLDFLDAAKQLTGEAIVLKVQEQLLKIAKDDPKSSDYAEAEAVRIGETNKQALLDLVHTYAPAFTASPTQEVTDAISDCYQLIFDKKDGWIADLRDVIAKIENDLDDWIVRDA